MRTRRFRAHIITIPLATLLAATITPSRATPALEPVWSFGLPPKESRSELVPGPDGYYWGTTYEGGVSSMSEGGSPSLGAGTIYKVKADGSQLQLVYSLVWPDFARGRALNGALVDDGAGHFWGLATGGGNSAFVPEPYDGHGIIYKINASTAEFTAVAAFTGNTGAAKGSRPYGSLVPDGAGFLWGTTSVGGTPGHGTVFKVNMATGQVTTVVEFTGACAGPGPAQPLAGLINDGNGFFWGTTSAGGAAGKGTIFKVAIASGALSVVAEFTGNTGSTKGTRPAAQLFRASDGYFWGSTTNGGVVDAGTLFKVWPETGEFITVNEFAGGQDGSGPAGKLVEAAGFLYGTANGGDSNNGTIFKVDPLTGAKTRVQIFPPRFDAEPLGAKPSGGLTLTSEGWLLGTASAGGTAGNGTLLKVNPDSGAVTKLHDFTDAHWLFQGFEPTAGLTTGPDGLLWGVTDQGGTKLGGTVFKLDPVEGAFTTVEKFTILKSGTLYYPVRPQPLVRGAGDILWGTVTSGGTVGNGFIYKIDTSTGTATTVYNFQGAGAENQGAGPKGPLAPDGNGFFWGVTFSGGPQSVGTVFKFNTATAVYSHIDSFRSTPQGQGQPGTYPLAGMVSDGAGFMWGTTSGYSFQAGSVFKVNRATGVVTTVKQFSSDDSPPGWDLRGDLIADGQGFIWGTTAAGGAWGAGTVFKFQTSTGQFTSVASFGVGGAVNSARPWCGVTKGPDGFYWGTTFDGGSGPAPYQTGTVFRLNPATGILSLPFQFAKEGPPAAVGWRPGAGSLCLHTDGNFYGSTRYGGTGGGGTVYRIRFGPSPLTLHADPLGSDAVLHGTVHPHGTATTTGFEWSPAPSLAGAAFAPAANIPAGDAPVPVSTAISGLTPGTVYYYRITGTNPENTHTQKGAVRSFTAVAPTPLQLWRQMHFGSPANSGPGADLSDADSDGEVNLVEFAFGSHPLQSNSRSTPALLVTATDFSVTFNEPPGIAGIIYGAESSPAMAPGTWMNIPDTGTAPQHRFAVPHSGNSKSFVRLKVTVQP